MSNAEEARSAPPAQISALAQATYARLEALLQHEKSPQHLNSILRLMAKWRTAVMVNTIVKIDGQVVQGGPFKGMSYMSVAAEGSTAARLLGVYEAALHPIIEAIIAEGYPQIIDVGCAEGYYAVGLARRMRQARIIARDPDAAAREKCAALAAANDVAGQIEIGGAMGHADFDICTRAKTLVICDIEGAEAQLLDPALAQGLLSADILVEVHDCFTPGLSGQIAQRFAASHDVQIIQRSLSPAPLPAWMDSFSDLDRLIALWEWRIGPTPWLWMRRKERASKKGKSK